MNPFASPTRFLAGTGKTQTHKLQINIKLQCPPVCLDGNEQNQFIFGIYYLVLFKHHEITLLINILPKMVKKRSLRN